MKKILIIGASGMAGSTFLRYLSANSPHQVVGTVRSLSSMGGRASEFKDQLFDNVDVESDIGLLNIFNNVRPNLVINCVGVVKQLSSSNNPLVALPLNSLLPHRLAVVCKLAGARLIHLSTDCVFTGNDGLYTEDDIPDAQDLYGVSKRLGEVNCPHAITLRTSIIGHELKGNRSLIDWFLSQEGRIDGFDQAIYSGLPAVEIARIIKDFVIPNDELSGLYHVSSSPITKYELLNTVAEIYGKNIEIKRSSGLKIDRSLDATKFNLATGFSPEKWPEMVTRMRDFG